MDPTAPDQSGAVFLDMKVSRRRRKLDRKTIPRYS